MNSADKQYTDGRYSTEEFDPLCSRCQCILCNVFSISHKCAQRSWNTNLFRILFKEKFFQIRVIEKLYSTGFQLDSIIAVSIRGMAIAVPFNQIKKTLIIRKINQINLRYKRIALRHYHRCILYEDDAIGNQYSSMHYLSISINNLLEKQET